MVDLHFPESGNTRRPPVQLSSPSISSSTRSQHPHLMASRPGRLRTITRLRRPAVRPAFGANPAATVMLGRRLVAGAGDGAEYGQPSPELVAAEGPEGDGEGE